MSDSESSPGTDAVLSLFVKMAEQSQFEVSITLLVHGAIVTGMITSGQKYMAAMGETLASGVIDPAQQEIYRNGFKGASEAIAASGADQEPNYIHLRQAQVVHGSVLSPQGAGVWWRGALESVDGWFLGLLATAPPV